MSRRWDSSPLSVSSGRWGGLLGTVHFRRRRKLARTGWRASVSRRVRTAGPDVEVGAGGEARRCVSLEVDPLGRCAVGHWLAVACAGQADAQVLWVCLAVGRLFLNQSVTGHRSSVFRDPIRPVLKHGPRSLARARVVGCENPKAE